jgi:hypothetical protein
MGLFSFFGGGKSAAKVDLSGPLAQLKSADPKVRLAGCHALGNLANCSPTTMATCAPPPRPPCRTSSAACPAPEPARRAGTPWPAARGRCASSGSVAVRALRIRTT